MNYNGKTNFTSLLCHQKALSHNIKYWIVSFQNEKNEKVNMKWSLNNLKKIEFKFEDILSDLKLNIDEIERAFPGYQDDFFEELVDKNTTIYLIYNYIKEILNEKKQLLNKEKSQNFLNIEENSNKNLNEKIVKNKDILIQEIMAKKLNEMIEQKKNPSLQKIKLRENITTTMKKHNQKAKKIREYDLMNDKIRICGKVYNVPKHSWYYADTGCWSDFEEKVKNTLRYKWKKITDPYLHELIDKLKVSNKITKEEELDYRSDEYIRLINKIKEQIEEEYLKNKK